jgi:DNA polymerase III alpha subunit
MVCPMVKQRDSSEKIAGLEMSDLEALGHVKFDVLGINLLDKIMYIKKLTTK